MWAAADAVVPAAPEDTLLLTRAACVHMYISADQPRRARGVDGHHTHTMSGHTHPTMKRHAAPKIIPAVSQINTHQLITIQAAAGNEIYFTVTGTEI